MKVTKEKLEALALEARRLRARAAMADDPADQVRLTDEAAIAQRVADLAWGQFDAARQEAQRQEDAERRERDRIEATREHRRRYLSSALPGAVRVVEQRRAELASARRGLADAEQHLAEAEHELARLRDEAGGLAA